MTTTPQRILHFLTHWRECVSTDPEIVIGKIPECRSIAYARRGEQDKGKGPLRQ